MKRNVSALILTGYGLNCDYETEYSLKRAGALARKVHVNELINKTVSIADFDIMVFIGGFSWADDHGAGVILATRLKNNIGSDLQRFIQDGKLMIGICNGFQTMVNLGILPGFNGNYDNQVVALVNNESGNFRDQWVKLKINKNSPCVFTKNLDKIELPIRHAEGKFYTENNALHKLMDSNQVVLQYALPNDEIAQGKFPFNPNGSMMDIAGICDPTGRIFGLMPHPEAYNNFANHPQWSRKKDLFRRHGKLPVNSDGMGLKIFQNAVQYIMSIA